MTTVRELHRLLPYPLPLYNQSDIIRIMDAHKDDYYYFQEGSCKNLQIGETPVTTTYEQLLNKEVLNILVSDGHLILYV